MSVPQEELPILEAVINIRNRLTALKKDRGHYVRAQDVLSLYHAVVKQGKNSRIDKDQLLIRFFPPQVTRLNDVREEQQPHKNRVDTTLSDQLLDHMNESAVYSETDLVTFHRRIEELREIVRRDAESDLHPEAMTKLLDRQLNECDSILNSMQESLSELSVELIPLHEKLINLRRQLVALAAKEGSVKNELKPLQEELRKIEAKRVDGKFLGPGGSSVPTSQALLSSLLEECFEISQEIRAREVSKHVATSLKPIYDRLSEIRAELENLVLTHRWSLRETDLWNYSLSLREIDKLRVDGKFVDAEGDRPPGQYVLLYLLRRCYGLIYRLLSSSEPVSEELMPIANKLSTVKKCLNEVLKYGGPFSPRDLYPYQLALHQIDSMQKDGKFVSSDGSIPEGQGIVIAHLNECHELVEMLKESMAEDVEDEEEEEMI
ncbi:hypothetical protein Clacol_005496 [Clathrus columnatus]|uniref:Uncharacterized protein n=1 Tax=Clathrus columnatus TaxID=1419009 RepID=A0AAV5A9J2_9AGAM|nr:hypothetical protein Clacol_005496 [Clathrus columnatus]